MTDLGPLDVLGTIEGGRGYEELVPDALVNRSARVPSAFYSYRSWPI
jgi:hypothetical protein